MAVVAAHAGALWALHNGLQNRPLDAIEPPVILVELAAAQPAPPSPPARVAPPQPTKPAPRKPTPAKPTAAPTVDTPAPTPVATTPRTHEVAPAVAPPAAASPTASSTAATGPAVPAAPPAPPAAPKIELPSSRADYLNNPKPEIPTVSRRLGEQGLVTLRVFIDTQGQPAQVEVLQSSGYTRLDEVARTTVLKTWRFVPGKRNGTPEAMWVNVPINFVLK